MDLLIFIIPEGDQIPLSFPFDLTFSVPLAK